MKLFQALKLKNKIIGEISNIKNQINQSNSVSNLQKNYYVSKDLLEKLIQYIKDLNDLKVAINLANTGIQKTIYELAETKTLLTFIKSLNTTEGKIRNYSHFSSNVSEDEMIVSINELEKNNLIKQYQDLIDKLQDQIDIYNHTNDCIINEKELLINK